MSLEFSGIDENIVFSSFADNEGYYLYVDGRNIKYSYKDYLKIIKLLWKCYLENNVPPMILGYEVSMAGFVNETLHCIAPDNWNERASYQLGEDREEFIDYLMGKGPLIKEKLETEDFDYLFNELSDIVSKNLIVKHSGIIRHL